jgi:peroxiredoxin
MKFVVLAASLVISGVLALLFARALPAAAERARTARQDALCEPALATARRTPTLGPFPAEAPDFTLADYAGNPISLASLRGRVVLVNFWATWCQTCVVEMPSLEKLVKAERDRPFTLLAVSVDDTWDVVRSFFAQGTKMTVLLDKERRVPGMYGTEKYPESFIIDREGKIRYYVISDRDWNKRDVRECVESLLD